MEQEEIKKAMSYLGKLSVKKQKKTKKEYSDMAKIRWLKYYMKHNKKPKTYENTNIRKK